MGTSTPAPLFALTMAACWALAWLLTHHNLGLYQDAVLYTLQALNHLHPQLYSNDLFFRFGSQDSFTVFTPVYAFLIERLGIATAAAVLVLTLTAILLFGAWALARQLMPAGLAWLSVGLLVVTPTYYGAYRIFKVGEEFISARLPAEALLLTATAALLAGKRAWAWGLLLLAGAIHPLMTLPVIAVFALLSIDERRLPAVILAGAAGLALICLVAAFAPTGRVSLMDSHWLHLVELTSKFLFMDLWPVHAYERVLLILSTVWFAALAPAGTSVRRLCRATLVVGVAGLLVTFLTLYIPVAILMQVQPWRALWFATALAILSLPCTVTTLWRGTRDDKAVAAIFVCAWMLQDVSMHAAFLVPLAMAIWLLPKAVKQRYQRYIVSLAGLLASVTAVWTVTAAYSTLSVSLRLEHEAAAFERVRNLFGVAAAGIAAVFLLWIIIVRLSNERRGWIASAIALSLSGTTAASVAWAQWVAPAIASIPSKQFDDWKAIIPPGAQVLWLWDPVPTWFLLERPSYMSYAQASGIVFSRETALMAERRAERLRPLVKQDLMLGANLTKENAPKPLTRERLVAICRDPDLAFVVTSDDAGVAAARKASPLKDRYLRLYDCSTTREEH